MSEFNPGDGWRELDLRDEGHLHAIYQLAQYDRDSGELLRAWVQEEPVPPLPTADNTVIRPAWRAGIAHNYERLVLAAGAWWVVGVAPWHAIPQALIEQITGFEVLAEPRKTDLPEFTNDPFGTVRRQTAKAVLDRVRERSEARWLADMTGPLADIAREFGVQS